MRLKWKLEVKIFPRLMSSVNFRKKVENKVKNESQDHSVEMWRTKWKGCAHKPSEVVPFSPVSCLLGLSFRKSQLQTQNGNSKNKKIKKCLPVTFFFLLALIVFGTTAAKKQDCDWTVTLGSLHSYRAAWCSECWGHWGRSPYSSGWRLAGLQ